MQEVIVLRDLEQQRLADPLGAGFRQAGPSVWSTSLLPPRPTITLETVDARGLAELLREPDVAGVARPMPIALIEPLSAPSSTRAWGIDAIGAAGSAFTGAGTVVAVLDTGIDAAHPAFAGVRLAVEDFTASGTEDRNGHGTHVAATLFGQDVAGHRIGIARGVTDALIGKVLNDDGGSSQMLFDGISWAMRNGASVIAMSLGFDFPGLVARLTGNGWPADLATSHALESYRGNLRMFDTLMAMNRANQAFGTGAVVVAAAGNESRRGVDPDYSIGALLPAATEGVLSVGAAGRGEGGLIIADFSNVFPQLAAPGIDVLSAQAGGGLVTLSGTSMACPHVAGVAALWWEHARAAGQPARADLVASKTLAAARTNVFAPDVGSALRGAGLVAAP